MPQIQSLNDSDLPEPRLDITRLRKRRGGTAHDISHSLNHVAGIMVTAISLLRIGTRSEAETSLLNLLEHAAREAEEIASRVVGLAEPIVLLPDQKGSVSA